VISSSQRPLPDNTQHSQQTNIHAPGGIPTQDLSRRAAADLRHRPCGHWDRQGQMLSYFIIKEMFNVRVHSKTVHKVPEEERYNPTLSLTSALDWVGSQRHVLAALPSGMLQYALHKRLGPMAGLDRCGKFCTYPASIPGPSSRSESLYRLRYPGLQIFTVVKRFTSTNQPKEVALRTVYSL
jgi:hypothetical protein